MDDKLLDSAFTRLIKILNENISCVSNLSPEAGEKLERFGGLLEELKNMIVPKYRDALRKLESFEKVKEEKKNESDKDLKQIVSARPPEFDTTEDLSTPQGTGKSNTVKTDAFSISVPLEEPPLIEKRSVKRHSSLREMQGGSGNSEDNGIISNLLRENESLKEKCVSLQKRYNKLFEAKASLELTKRSQAVQIKELTSRLEANLPKEDRAQGGGIRYEERKRSLLPVEMPRSFSFLLKKLAMEEEESHLLTSDRKVTDKKGPSLSLLIANNLRKHRESESEEENNDGGSSRYIGQLHFDNMEMNSPMSVKNPETTALFHYNEVSVQSSLMKMNFPEGFSNLRKEFVDRLPREEKGGKTQFPAKAAQNKTNPAPSRFFCCKN